MEYIVPVQPTTFSVHPVLPVQKSADAVQNSLQPYQVIQASVAETGDGRVLLEMAGQRLWAESKADVQNGQTLNLQVLSTHPRLQLQVVPPGLGKNLLRLLHLFDHKSEIGARLQQLATSIPETLETQHKIQQLAQNFLGQRTITPTGPQMQQAAGPLIETLQNLQSANPGIRQNLAGMLQQLADKPAQTGMPPLPAHVHNVATQIVTNLASVLDSLGAMSNQESNQHLELIFRPLLQPHISSSDLGLLHARLQSLAAHNPQTSAPALSSTESSQAAAMQPLFATLMQSLSNSVAAMQQHMAVPPAQELALLVQVLGLNFEAQLLNQEIEQAQQSLKGMLLQMQAQEDAPEQARENSAKLVQQIELFQLCRTRLAQDSILFLPLPFDFLAQGYALIQENQHKSPGNSHTQHKQMNVALNVTLENLGNLNINMLFEHSYLYVKISCAEPATMLMLEESRLELSEILQPFGLQRLNIDTGAKDPAVALMEKLKPDTGVLDAHA